MCLFVPKDLGNSWTDMVVIYVNLLIDPEKAYNFFLGRGLGVGSTIYSREITPKKSFYFFFLN